MLAERLARVPLATLPTPVREIRYARPGRTRSLWIKSDNLTGEPYGGNKVRKLEYLFRPPVVKRRRRIATFGAVGSHHALATALYSRQLGFACTCFLSHQTRTTSVPATLNMHLRIGTELVPFGGSCEDRVATLRRYLWDRNAWVIPAGGSSWLGAVGFVNAGLEVADQIARGDLPVPHRLYVASGTMSTAAGLALGLALANLPVTVHAVRVSHTSIANEAVLARLMHKTTMMLNRIDPSFPANLADRARVVLRHEYFGRGYAHSNAATDAALATAAEQFDLTLESTYTGKAMAALLDDVDADRRDEPVLFWNTYHSAPLDVAADRPLDAEKLPQEFLGYFL